MRINSDDLVLEVGSGDRPNPRSDVLVDRFISDNTERGGNLQIDRPLICADGHFLPFKDKTFDYVIASHIIEHMDDPVRFCQELMRVSKRGYIESPTEVAEKMFFWSFHKWYVNRIGDTITMQYKDTPNNVFGDLFDYFYEYNPWYERFQRSAPDVFWMTYEWDGEIKVKVVGESPLKLEDRKALLRMVRPKGNPLQSALTTVRTLAKSAVPRKLRPLLKRLKRSKRRAVTPVSLERILSCPDCPGSDVRIVANEVICQTCSRWYPIKNGIPYLLPSDETAAGMVQSHH